MVPANITTHTESATVVRGGVSVEVLDTATLVSISDPMAEISNQLARRAAEYIDAKLVLQADLSPNLFDQNLTASQTNVNGTMDAAAISKAYTTTLGDQHGALLQGGYIVMHSKVFGDLLITGAIQNQYQIGPLSSQGVIAQGPVALPMVAGLRIHVSDRVTSNTISAIQQYKSYLIAPEALGLFYQRQVLIEFDRDILLRSDIVAASVDFAPHLYGFDDSTSAIVEQDNNSIKVVRINSL